MKFWISPNISMEFSKQVHFYTQVGINLTAFFTFKQQYSTHLLTEYPFKTLVLLDSIAGL